MAKRKKKKKSSKERTQPEKAGKKKDEGRGPDKAGRQAADRDGSGAGPGPTIPPSLHKAGNVVSHPALLVVACIVFTFAMRVWVAHFYPKSPDSFQYLALAQEIASGEYFQGDYDLAEGFAKSRRLVPFYPALIAAGMKLGADPELAGAWISLFMAALAVVPLFFAGVKLGGKWAGFMACLLYSINPLALRYTGHVLTEDAFALLTAGSVFFVLVLIERPVVWRALLLGVACVLSYLTRDIGFGYVFIALGLIVISGCLLEWPWKTTGTLAAACLAAFIVVSSPFWIFIRVHTGEWKPSLRQVQSMKADLMGYERGEGPRAMEDEDEEESRDKAPAEVSFNPIKAAVKTIRLTADYTSQVVKGFAWTFWVLVVLGMVLMPSRGRLGRAIEIALWAWVLAVMAAYAFITPHMVTVRYYLPAVVLSTLWAGRGAALLPLLPKRFFHDTRATYFSVILIAAVGLAAGHYLFDSYKQARYVKHFYEDFRAKTVSGHKEIALDAKAKLGIKPGARIIARKMFFAYYLDGHHVRVAETVEGVREQIKNREGDYVFIGSMSVNKYRRGLKPLITAADPFPDAGLVYRRYLEEYNKLFSVYKPGAPPFKLDIQVTKENAQRVLADANKLFRQGYVEHARHLYLALADVLPDNALVHWKLMNVYLLYGAYDGVSLDKARDELMKYSLLSPGDDKTAEYERIIENIRHKYRVRWGR